MINSCPGPRASEYAFCVPTDKSAAATANPAAMAKLIPSVGFWMSYCIWNSFLNGGAVDMDGQAFCVPPDKQTCERLLLEKNCKYYVT